MHPTLDGSIEDFIAQRWEESPEAATAAGVAGYDDRLTDHSADAYARRDAQVDAWITTFEAVPDDGLSLDQIIDRDFLLSHLRGLRVMRDWQGWRRSADAYLSSCLQGVFALFLHRVLPEDELAAAVASRLRQTPAVLAHAKANLDPSLAAPMLVQRSIGMARAGVTYARTLVPFEVPEGPHRAALAEAGETAATALEDFAAFLAEFAERATGGWAIGEQRYSALLTQKEMLGYGAREMRERGRAAYAELDEDMRRRAQHLRGTDDWRAVMDELNADHPETPEEMRETYAEWTERARVFGYEQGLVTEPEGEVCLVEPSPPFQRPILAVASYQVPPAFRPTRTGHFFVPFPPDGTPPEEVQKRLATNSRNSIPSVSVHEAYPGHHWHLVTAQGNPRTIRKVLWTPYFVEGWALYAEILMREAGFFTDPRHEMCQVDARIFRAARMIVDTSLHLGEMTVDEAVEFMSTKASLTEPTARAEVLRYCSWPTQAPSYLTGSLEIERIRERFLSEGKGTLREFNDRIAGSGGLPIALAERALMES